MTVRSPHLATVTALIGCFLLLVQASVSAADPPAGAVVAVPVAPAATPVELPGFQPGLWEYKRTLMSDGWAKPQVSTIKKCTDPTTDMREKFADLRKKSCHFEPLKRNNDRYLSSWLCQTPSGAMRFRDVLIAKDLTSYEDLLETRSGQHMTQQRIEARRLGECPGLGVGAPLKSTPKPRG